MTDPDGATGLDDQLCFALYSATNSIVRAYRPLLDEVGLTYPQYLIMLVLWREGDLSVGRLAARLNLPPHAISPMLDRMEAHGLVARLRDDTDRRLVHVALTEAGARLEPAVAEVQRAVACRTSLGSDEIATLRTALHALAAEMSGTDTSA
ncbi:MarR family winged helix-turn-helix transcriptional regulator [Jatrophihabitans endophyticus]|uniref:MarR family winged helix-turn-helix transcriptional regulator n=1 Tax=Jatrophihabitans endophyticus TaxID=1206085 RepID=UPI0019DA6D27|nr:MarR family transcriptional regulator [Jatrophihabitans endophyticus]MBE7188743.1 MarR family transcriptional regulator [Jatrophihabitans endophyticus]